MSQATPPLRLAEVVAALSLATDLGTGHTFERSLRACLLAVNFGQTLGLDEATLRDVYYLTLLRWVGCTADSHRAEIFKDEIALGPQIDSVELWNLEAMLGFLRQVIGQGETPQRREALVSEALETGVERSVEAAVAHCEVAQNIAGRLEFGPSLLAALGQIFERWDGKGVPGVATGEGVSLAVRLMHLAMDGELFWRLGGAAAVRNVVEQRAGGFYDPDLAARFLRATPELFEQVSAPSVWEAVLAAEPGVQSQLTAGGVDAALHAIADFIDVRSPFTLGHSPAVAALAEAGAHLMGLPAAEVEAARRAGLVHDVGMTALPLLLCEKEGPLNAAEWERVRLHPYYAERILARPPALARYGELAGLHHERLDGSGYHRGLPGSLLPPVARLLAAADVYQALIEPRPHRPAFERDAAAAEMRREVREGRLDAASVQAVLAAAGHGGSGRPTQVAGLTERELEVLALLVRSQTNKQIAAALTLSERTVDHHIRHIYTKIGVSTRAGATMFAIQHHLISE